MARAQLSEQQRSWRVWPAIVLVWALVFQAFIPLVQASADDGTVWMCTPLGLVEAPAEMPTSDETCPLCLNVCQAGLAVPPVMAVLEVPQVELQGLQRHAASAYISRQWLTPQGRGPPASL